MKFHYPAGATPLDPNELEGLIADYVSTQDELNEVEKNNILEASNWAMKSKKRDPLDPSFIYQLHKKMFDRVWRWAGKQRTSEKNIGVPWVQISSRLAHLIANVKHWIENEVYNFDEIGARFHHGIVLIHIFPNGNGRHARLITDVLMNVNGCELFSWGSGSLANEGELRTRYIEALRQADKQSFQPLIKFVRS